MITKQEAQRALDLHTKREQLEDVAKMLTDPRTQNVGASVCELYPTSKTSKLPFSYHIAELRELIAREVQEQLKEIDVELAELGIKQTAA
jgi:hypothetical protein